MRLSLLILVYGLLFLPVHSQEKQNYSVSPGSNPTALKAMITVNGYSYSTFESITVCLGNISKLSQVTIIKNGDSLKSVNKSVVASDLQLTTNKVSDVLYCTRVSMPLPDSMKNKSDRSVSFIVQFDPTLDLNSRTTVDEILRVITQESYNQLESALKKELERSNTVTLDYFYTDYEITGSTIPITIHFSITK